MVFNKFAFIAAAVALCVSAPVFARQPDSSQWITPGCHESSIAPETRGLSCEEAVQRFHEHVKQIQQKVATDKPDGHKCFTEAYAYSIMVAVRNNGFSPQQAAQDLNVELYKANREALPAWAVKKVVNMIYFDARMQDIGQDDMFQGVYQVCMHPDSGYKPLK